MKVVIDIPESLYRFYKTHIGSGKLKIEEDILGRLLNDGVVLPKGHGDLIDRSVLVNELNEQQIEFDEFYKGLGRAKTITNNAPTVIEADWEYCSNCNKVLEPQDKFCWNCGAEIVKESKE